MKIPVLPGFDPEAFRKYVANAGWFMIAKVGTLLIKMLVGIAVANYLGSSQNGILAYPLALISFFLAASALGLDTYLTRELIENPRHRDRLLGTAFRVRLIAGMCVLPLIYMVFAYISSYSAPPAPFGYIVIVSFICVLQATHVLDSYFQAQTSGKTVMTIQIIANLISAVVKLTLLYLGAQLVWFVWSLLADALFVAVGFLWMYRRTGLSPLRWEFDRRLSKVLIKRAWPLAFSAVLVTLYMKIDQVMIGSLLSDSELGIYSTVVSLSESWYFIPVAIVAAVFPAIMNARRDDRSRYEARIQNLYDFLSLVSISIALVMTFASNWLYSFLYTAEYAQGATVLSIHIWAAVFVFLGTASSQYLIAERYLKLALVRTAAGAVINIGLNALWIPMYGINGAAVATLIAYAASTFFVLIVPKTTHQGVMMLRSIFLINIFRKLFFK